MIGYIKQHVNTENVVIIGSKLIRELMEDSENTNYHYVAEFYDAGDFKET